MICDLPCFTDSLMFSLVESVFFEDNSQLIYHIKFVKKVSMSFLC